MRRTPKAMHDSHLPAIIGIASPNLHIEPRRGSIRDMEPGALSLSRQGHGPAHTRAPQPRPPHQAPVAQWIEQAPSKRLAAGSSPAGGARLCRSGAISSPPQDHLRRAFSLPGRTFCPALPPSFEPPVPHTSPASGDIPRSASSRERVIPGQSHSDGPSGTHRASVKAAPALFVTADSSRSASAQPPDVAPPPDHADRGASGCVSAAAPKNRFAPGPRRRRVSPLVASPFGFRSQPRSVREVRGRIVVRRARQLCSAVDPTVAPIEASSLCTSIGRTYVWASPAR